MLDYWACYHDNGTIERWTVVWRGWRFDILNPWPLVLLYRDPLKRK